MQQCTACFPEALMFVCIPGDPVEAVLLALEAAERVFGVDMNSRGYKVPKGCGVIQGDGISIEMLDNILRAVMAKGYSRCTFCLICHGKPARLLTTTPD